ncbi:MAG TPA: universal stress protein [Gaiellaceae bacterium]|nr:universal stress protein [Gaiellaceae bacterium]
MNHVLVIANETVAGQTLIEALKSRAAEEETRVTVVAPINEPREGYVVYEDTRRAAAGRRLDRTLRLLREAGIPASGLVVDADPVNATRDAIAQAEPPIDSVIVSTHPPERSGWMQRNVPERVRKAAGSVPVEHVVVDMQAEGGPANVLVVANETVVGERLLEWIRERARRSPASFLIVSPQSDPSVSAHPQAERRLRRALTILRGEGLDAHGQVAHPDPYSAAMHAVRDERVDEILVSTFPEARGSSWLRRDLIGRLRKDAGVPVEHIEITPEEVSVAS